MVTLGRFHYLEALPRGVSSLASRPRGTAGEVQGTLVLIHGFPLSARTWEPQLGLADHGWRIIAPSLRGFDGTSPSTVATSIDDFAGDVIDLLDALHIENAVIGGLSMGGYITFAMFRHAPGYFRGMILADTRAQADTPEGVEGRKKMIAAVREQGAAAAAEAMLPKLLCDVTRSNTPSVVEQIRAMILANPTDTIVGAITALMSRPDATPLLSQIHCPTLVIVGEQDALTPPDLSRQIQQGIRGAGLAIIPDAGHMSNMEQPVAFNDVLARFLDRNV